MIAPSRAEFHAEQSWPGDIGDTARAFGEFTPVFQDQPDDLTKPEGDDGEIIAAQTQDRKTEEDTEEGCQPSADGQHRPEAELEMMVQQGIGIGAHRIKSDIAQIEQTGHADHDIQTKTQHYIHQGRGHDIGLVGGRKMREGKGHGQQQTDQDISLFGVCQDAMDKGSFLVNFTVGLGFQGPGFPMEKEFYQEIDQKGADSHKKRIFPAPPYDAFDGVNLDDHDGKSQKNKPERGQQCSFYFLQIEHGDCSRLTLSWFPLCRAGRTV